MATQSKLRGLAALAAAATFIPSAHAWYNDLPSCLTSFDPFVPAGCYDNGKPGQTEALTLRTDLDQEDMTVQTCVAHCKGNGYRFAGLAYYGVCYCGMTVSTALLPDDQCSFPCTGNSSQTCGGDTQVNLWMDPTFEKLEDQTVSDYVYSGCWSDESPEGRALFYRQNQIDGGSLTTEKCLSACLAGGFPFAGTEFSSECYCGVVIGNGTAAADESQCNKPCNGDTTETCGGSGKLSLYVAKDLQSLEPCGYIEPPPTSPTCTATATPPAPTCEYQCGKWCSSPLPDWNDKTGCLSAWSQCAKQVASCFLKAGFPDAMDCFNFADWCGKVKDSCGTDWHGGKSGCYGKNPPKNNLPAPTVAPTTVPSCTAATTTTTTTSSTTSTTTSVPVPTPTGICKQPSNPRLGYSTDSPVGDIELPIVTCNDLEQDYKRGNVFKLYTNTDSRQCKSYSRPRCSNACQDACKAQYDECTSVYARGCDSNGKSGGKQYGKGYDVDRHDNYGWYRGRNWRRATETGFDEEEEEEMELEARHWGSTSSNDRWNQSGDQARRACAYQYNDCLAINKRALGDGKCTAYNNGW